jgi:MFS family permease
VSRADRLGPLAVLAAALWQFAPLFRTPWATKAIIGTDSYRSHDWLEVAKLDHYARVAILEFGRLPLWNPLIAGGLPQFAHPSDGSASPLFLSSLVLGETLGMKVNVALVGVLGALGMWLLLRRAMAMGPAAATLGGVAFAWAGWLPSRLAVGFYEACLMAAWPMVLALWLMPGERPERRRRWVAAALLLWTLAIQLQLAVPVLVLWMALLWGTAAALDWLAGRPVDRATALGGLAVLAVAGLLGAVKFLPMLDLLAAGEFREATVYPTHPDAWYRSFAQVGYGLFHRVPEVPIVDADGNPRIQEYMTLLPGLGVLLLAGFALPSTLRREHRALPFVVSGAIFGWLCFGPHAWVDGFRGLSLLPFFSSMRGPLRYFNYPLLVGLIVLAAAGVDAAGERWGERSTWIAAALAIALGWPAARDARALYDTAFLYAAEELPKQASLRSEGLSTRSTGRAHRLNLRKYSNIRRGVPTIYVPEDLPIEVAAVPAVVLQPDGTLEAEPGYRGEAWAATAASLTGAEEPAPGTARVVALRPQEIVVEHSLKAPGLVLINQNAWDGWTCGERPVSAEAATWEGLLGFEAPAGDRLTTTCRWWPRGLLPGAALSLLGLIGAGALWPWRRAGRPRR